jgi:hypothetical protein
MDRGETEFRLPSGDSVDVMFIHRGEHVAVEVKSAISDEGDITRGMFQCVKYATVLEAWMVTRKKSIDVRAILALEGSLSNKLAALKNLLGVEVISGLKRPN